ncbi:MAG: hypothetical protein WA220_08575, partial [Candidatus Nitrosopolaris sp.]
AEDQLKHLEESRANDSKQSRHELIIIKSCLHRLFSKKFSLSPAKLFTRLAFVNLPFRQT